MISEHQQSLRVQDTLSELAWAPPKLLSQTYDTGANFSFVDSYLKKDLPPVIVPCSKKINIGSPISSQEVQGVHLEPKDYFLPNNFEAVLDEKMYSDTVYALRRYYL